MPKGEERDEKKNKPKLTKQQRRDKKRQKEEAKQRRLDEQYN